MVLDWQTKCHIGANENFKKGHICSFCSLTRVSKSTDNDQNRSLAPSDIWPYTLLVSWRWVIVVFHFTSLHISVTLDIFSGVSLRFYHYPISSLDNPHDQKLSQYTASSTMVSLAFVSSYLCPYMHSNGLPIIYFMTLVQFSLWIWI